MSAISTPNQNPIRILVADDSALTRNLICLELSKDKVFQIIGHARDGVEAIELWKTLNPDILLLDVSMPFMDGVEVIYEIRKTSPDLPIIVFSSLQISIDDVYAAGANVFIGKPNNILNSNEFQNYIQDQLIPVIKSSAIHGSQITRSRLRQNPHSSVYEGIRPVSSGNKTEAAATKVFEPIANCSQPSNLRADVVAIGASTGGPRTLESILGNLPRGFSTPILIVQHMPKEFTKSFAERLNRVCHLTVREGFDGAAIEPGQVWIAPGELHMTVNISGEQRTLSITQGEYENSCRPSIDCLLRSVALHYGAKCLAVMLTGMGNDGLSGCAAIRQSGGRVIVQDQASCIVWGIPRAVQEAGYANEVVALSNIPLEISKRSR